MSHDPTEAIRRKLVPEVNQQGTEALMKATLKVAEELGPDKEVTAEEAEAIAVRCEEEGRALLRAKLVAEYGADNVFDTSQLTEYFDVIGFGAPLVVVTRKADGKKGSLFFTHHPRLYYGFQAH